MIYTLVKVNKQSKIESMFSFDSITSFEESWSATVTTQTVERGFDITDNINIEPPTFSIKAVLSSYVLFDSGKEIVWNGETFENQAEKDPKTFKDSTNRHIKARDELLNLFATKTIFNLVESDHNSTSKDLSVKEAQLSQGHLRVQDTVVISSLSISQPDSSSGAFYVDLKLQRIFMADVFVEELSEEDATAALTPMMATNTSISSSSSKGNSADPNDVAASPIDAPDSSFGNSQSEVSQEYSTRRLAELKYLSRVAEITAQTEIATTQTILTERGQRPVFKDGKGYTVPAWLFGDPTR